MHKIQEKEFTLDDFSTEHLFLESLASLSRTICTLNEYRNLYIEGGSILVSEDQYLTFEPKSKDIWWQMIQLLPSSYNQTRNVMLNYEVLANIYKSRKNHKLDEWRVHKTPEEHEFRNKDFSSGIWGFCDWIESLPYSELIVGSESKRYAKIGKSFSDGFQKGLGIDMESVEEAAKNYDPNDGVENHITLIKED